MISYQNLTKSYFIFKKNLLMYELIIFLCYFQFIDFRKYIEYNIKKFVND